MFATQPPLVGTTLFLPSPDLLLIAYTKNPKPINATINDPLWIQVMQSYKLLRQTILGISFHYLLGKKSIGCKWVYKIKLKSDGCLERYETQLAARGYTQEYGIDYQENFFAAIKMITMRCLCAIAASRHCSLFQLDVNNAFLHGDLYEEVYMALPPGLALPTWFVNLRNHFTVLNKLLVNGSLSLLSSLNKVLLYLNMVILSSLGVIIPSLL